MVDVKVGDMVKYFRGPPWFTMQVTNVFPGMIIVKHGSYHGACAPIALREVKIVVRK